MTAPDLPPADEAQRRWRRLLAQTAASWRDAGVTHWERRTWTAPLPAAAPAMVRAESAMASPGVSASPLSPAVNTSSLAESPMPAPRSAAARNRALQVIADEVAVCTLCSHLAATRTQTVFGVGDPTTRLVFMGEAPGADEDAQGEPFVGRAGQLLTDIITKGMKLRREDIYILNTIKCRPPGNRTPNEDEVANCRPFFERQLEILRPEFICCLGAVAAQTLLETKTAVGRLRGKLHPWRESQVLVTYHPAYLLRNPPAKKEVWEDIQILMRAMGLLKE